jgi:Domain of unknown function (DUF4382)
MLCAVALFLVACHSNISLPPGTPIMTMNQTTDRYTFAAYIITIDSISYTRNDGTIITPLSEPETIDLTRLTNYTEVVEAPAVPEGVYTAITLELDYSSPFIALSQDGFSVGAYPLDPIGGQLTTESVVVTLDPNNPLIVTQNQGVRLNIDMNLEASNTVTARGVPGGAFGSVTVQPFITASPAPVDKSPMRARGLFVTTQTLTNAFYMNLRPFYDLVSQLGAVIVNVSPTTYWQINGLTSVGLGALQQLPNLQPNVPVVAYGTLNGITGITPTFNATAVYIGTSQENPLLEYVTGTVYEREGDTLQIKGATYQDDTGVIEYFDTATVTVADTTNVTQDGVAAPNLGINNISVGQEVNVSGLATITAANALSIDASQGQVRLQPTPIFGELVSATPTTATLNLGLLDNYPPSAFSFAGTGSVDADPTAYTVSTAGTNLSTLAPLTLINGSGFVQPFGQQPPAFNATSIADASATPQTLVVEWNKGATKPFTSISSTGGLLVNLTQSLINGTHYVRNGSAFYDPQALTPQLTVAPAGVGQGQLVLAVGNGITTTGVQVFNTPAGFARAVSNTFNGTPSNQIYRLVALGQYDQANARFVATRIYVALQEDPSTT